MDPAPTEGSLSRVVIPLLRNSALAGYVRANLRATPDGCALWSLGCNRHGSALLNFEGHRMYVKTVVTAMHWADARGGLPDGLPDPRDAYEVAKICAHINHQRGIVQTCGDKRCFAAAHMVPIPPESPGCARARPWPPPRGYRKDPATIVRRKQR